MKFVLIASLATCLAHGSIIVSLDGPPAPIVSGPDAGDFLFTYTAELSGDERLDPAATGGVTCPGVGGILIQCVPSGTFFTVYDFAGLVSVGSVPADWIAFAQLSGLTPSDICVSCMDDPLIPNVTFLYTGPVFYSSGIDTPFDGFQIISTFGGINQGGAFSSQSTVNVGPSAGASDQVFGGLAVPAPGPANIQDTPELSTLFLMTAGLLGVSVLRRGTL